MLTQAGVGVLVERRAVEVRQRPVVLGEMPGDPVDEDPDACLVQPVDQIAEVVGGAVARGRRVEPGHLITPGTGERMLRDGEELNVGETEVTEVSGQGLGRLAVSQGPPPATGVLGQPPRAQVAFIDRHRGMQQVGGLLAGEPFCVLPFVPALGDNTRRGRRHLGGEGERVRAQTRLPMLAHHLELVARARSDPGQEDLPDPGAAQHSHRVQAAVPAVEVTCNPHRTGARRPDGERRTRHPLVHPHLRSEMPPQPLVPALGQQVQVKLPERGPMPVGIIDHHHGTLWIGHLQPVGRDLPPLHHPGEHPSRMHAVHLDPLLTGQDDHADRARTPPADHHATRALTIRCRVSAQQAVRIVVQTSDKTLEVRAVHHMAGMKR